MTIRPLSEIVDDLSRLTSDPAYGDELTTAVILLPCGHNTNQHFAEESMKRRKICPVNRCHIESFIPNQALRDIAKQVQDLKNVQELTLKKQLTSNISPLEVARQLPTRKIDILQNISLSELRKVPSQDFAIALKEIDPRSEPYGILCRNFARMLPTGTTISLDGAMCSREDLCKKSLIINPQDAFSYQYLAEIMGEEGIKETVIDQKVFSLKDLYRKIIEIKPEDRRVYADLVSALDGSETVTLDGVELRQKDLLLRAVQKDPTYFLSYLLFGQRIDLSDITQHLGTHLHSKRALFLKAIELNPEDGRAYAELADILESDDDLVKLGEEEYSKFELYRKAVHLGLKTALIYIKIINVLPKDNATCRINNDECDRKRLCQLAIEADPLYAKAYYYLGYFIKDGSIILMGQRFNQKELFIKAIQLDMSDAVAWYMLFNKMTGNEIIQINPEITVNQKDILKRLIEMGRNEDYPLRFKAKLYSKYAKLISQEEVVIILGKQMRQKDLCMKSLESDPYQSSIYAILSEIIEEDEEVTLLIHGKEKQFIQKELQDAAVFMGKIEGAIGAIKTLETKQEFEDEIEHNNKIAELYNELAKYLEGDRNLITGYGNLNYKKKEDLYLKCIDLNRECGLYYIYLGSLLKEDTVITLLDGRKMDKASLYTEGLRLSPINSDIYCEIAKCLGVQEEIQLNEKIKEFERISRKDLYLKAIQLAPQNADLYCYLAQDLACATDIVTYTVQGKSYDRRSLYVKSIELGPVESNPWLFLGIDLTISGHAMIFGKSVNKRALLVRGLEKERQRKLTDKEKSILASYHLAKAISPPPGFSKVGNDKVTKKDLYFDILTLNPRHVKACRKLLKIVGSATNGVLLKDGTRLTIEYLRRIASREEMRSV